MTHTRDFEEVGRLLKAARRVLFITGAGISAESGIPTFRGSTAVNPSGLTEEGLRFEEVLSGPMFQRRPELSWKYFFKLEESLRGKQPNRAHQVIAELAGAGRRVCVATQNIDGLHQEAGSDLVLELHGNLRRLICTGCDFQDCPATFEGLARLPRCVRCGGLLRPDVVLYEEPLPQGVLEQLEAEQERGFDLVFSVGTTSIFYYVIEPLLRAGHRDIPTVEINPELTPVSEMVDFRFAAAAGGVLEELRIVSGG